MIEHVITSGACEPITSIKSVLGKADDEIVIFSPYMKVESLR